MNATVTDMMAELNYLWGAERCAVKVWFDDPGLDDPWVVDLIWVSERDNPHQADWVEYTWEFRGFAVDEAIAEALNWAKGLVPFERCDACDGSGRGWDRSPDETLVCECCGGSGLAHNDPPEAETA